MVLKRSPLTVVCHQLQGADNLGSILRLMANFGVEELILSEPTLTDFSEAKKMAVGAEGRIDRIQVRSSLKEALQDAVWVLGSTSRNELRRRMASTPEHGISTLAEHARGGRVVLLLGGEKRGLSDQDLWLCHDIAVIPTGDEQPSMNLASATAVLLYLWSWEVAVRDSQPASSLEPVELAPMRLQQSLEERLSKILDLSGLETG